MRSKKKKKPLNTFMLHSKSTYFYKQRWFSYSIPLVSTLALLLVMGLCINPVGGLGNGSDSKKVYAADNIPGEPGYDDIIPENGVALRIDTTLNDKDTIEEQVSGSGTQYIKVDFTVGANNIQNYNVYVQAGSTALTGQAHGDKLQSITSNTTGTVGTRQWGYGVSRGSVDPSTMTYKPIQTSVSTSADSQDAGEGNTLTNISQPYTLAFAANLEGAASDHYKSNITLSVAAGAGEVSVISNWDDLVYMQDMNPTACAGGNETGKQLIDIRDGKKYWVAKLKDNNCWMTQNLAFDLDSSRELLPYTTDIVDYWTPSYSTRYGESVIFSNNNNLVQSYSPGQVYCKNGYCAQASDSSSNNGHDLQGNYYSWVAATAGTGKGMDEISTAEGSVCPKGWMLPLGVMYDTLLSGVTPAQAMQSPYYLLHGGKMETNGLTALSIGYYWSSSVSGNTTAVSKNLTDTGHGSAGDYYKYVGMSVRCVAR